MFSIKITKSYRDVVAVCDSELLGKTFEEGNFHLNVKVDFFREKEVNEDELPQFKLSELDTLVATTLELPMD